MIILVYNVPLCYRYAHIYIYIIYIYIYPGIVISTVLLLAFARNRCVSTNQHF